MTEIFNSKKAVGLRVKAPYFGTAVTRGTIHDVVPNQKIVVVYDPAEIGEWDESFEDIPYPYTNVKLDYDPEGMKLINQKWSKITGQVGGPLSPMKKVKSFMTGLGRKRKTRKTNSVSKRK